MHADACILNAMTTDSNRDINDYCLGLSLRRASRVLAQIYDHHLSVVDLKVTQFSIIRAIGRLGEANAKSLRNILTLDQTTLSRGLRLLVRDGLIEEFSGTDKREKRLTLSRQGKSRWRQAEKQWVKAQQHVAESLGPETCATLYQVSDAVLDLRSS